MPVLPSPRLRPTTSNFRQLQPCCRAQTAMSSQSTILNAGGDQESLLIRTLRGDDVDRSPVWMMRQAGRYMKAYQDLCLKHRTFRARSENAEVAAEITLQPWHAFRPDGVVLFSDILTPLTAMGISFDVLPGRGPVIDNPVRTYADVDAIAALDAPGKTPFIGEALASVSQAIGSEAAVLGFAGAPYTLASYIVEGRNSKSYSTLKRMVFWEPELLHALLDRLVENVVAYVQYQADHGAQAIQLFDSWASHLAPQDFDTFAAPYTARVIDAVRASHPHLPIILYIAGAGGLLERMAACRPDVLGIDASTDLGDAIRRCGTDFAYQGNIDPGVLLGPPEAIDARVRDTVATAHSAGVRHVLNLGHGVLPTTPEASVARLCAAARELRYSDL